MQILKRVKIKNRSAQNLVEFILVFPLLIFLTLVIFEVALFWQDVNSVYNLNEEINANVALVDNSNLNLGDSCPAAGKALDILKKRDSMISLNDPTYTKSTLDGNEPFALYKYSSTSSINANGGAKPQVALWVDCRSPFESGVTTQLEFYHKTLIMHASLPNFSNQEEPIVIIPDSVFIASPKLNTVRQY
jgi:hypothetical protein